ncbi:hypothetical protein SANTM175S_08988 [Streptomyces antimycoticus]
MVLRHCTLVPGWSLEPECEPRSPDEPSLVLERTTACVQIERSILGTIEVIGVEVYFAPDGAYRSGDHWLIPARTATGTVEWPVNAARTPLLQAPAGIRVHYAPLAWVTAEQAELDLRMVFGPLATPAPAADARALAAEAEADAETRAGKGAEPEA